MEKWPSKKNLYNILGFRVLLVLLLFVNLFLLQVGCFVFGGYLCFMRDAIMLKSGVYCERCFVANVCIVEIGWLLPKDANCSISNVLCLLWHVKTYKEILMFFET